MKKIWKRNEVEMLSAEVAYTFENEVNRYYELNTTNAFIKVEFRIIDLLCCQTLIKISIYKKDDNSFFYYVNLNVKFTLGGIKVYKEKDGNETSSEMDVIDNYQLNFRDAIKDANKRLENRKMFEAFYDEQVAA
jgi:hypothetical protein